MRLVGSTLQLLCVEYLQRMHLMNNNKEVIVTLLSPFDAVTDCS